MRISDWSSDVCSSDLTPSCRNPRAGRHGLRSRFPGSTRCARTVPIGLQEQCDRRLGAPRRRSRATVIIEQGADERFGRHEVEELRAGGLDVVDRSEEHTSELQSLMRISYAVFCLKKKNK